LQIADTTAAETEVYHMMTNGTILDIGRGSNLRNFTEEIRNQVERESRIGKLYSNRFESIASGICIVNAYEDFFLECLWFRLHCKT
jgi:hypothetical protein